MLAAAVFPDQANKPEMILGYNTGKKVLISLIKIFKNSVAAVKQSGGPFCCFTIFLMFLHSMAS